MYPVSDYLQFRFIKVIVFQLSKDGGNAEANQQMVELPQLRAMLDRAHYLKDHNDFSGAEQELSKLMDVCRQTLLLLFSLFMSFLLLVIDEMICTVGIHSYDMCILGLSMGSYIKRDESRLLYRTT